MSNGLHEGEMALELAEYDRLHMTVAELLDIAGDALRTSWLQRAVLEPQRVRDQYNNLIGER
jgi:hypothetical protein